MTRRAKILAACYAEIVRLQRFVVNAEQRSIFDWWQTDLVDWFEPQDRLYLSSPDDGGEHLPTRVFYKANMERDGSEWTATGIERLQVFVELYEYLPATDVTDLLGEDILAGYRDMACVDAERKAADREANERAEARHLARMEA